MQKIILISVFLIASVLTNVSNSQLSNIEIEKERTLYKYNKVKSEIVTDKNNYNTVTQIDTEGKRINTKGYYNGKETNNMDFTYDLNGRLIETNYYGYESGDGYSSKYYYDEKGNVNSIVTEGGDVSKKNFIYDQNGTVTFIEIEDIGMNSNPPFVIEFENNYKEGKLFSTLQLCNFKISEAEYTEYHYNLNLLIFEEKLYKDCKNGSLNFDSKTSFTYYDNNLLKEILINFKQGDYERSQYSYDFYSSVSQNLQVLNIGGKQIEFGKTIGNIDICFKNQYQIESDLPYIKVIECYMDSIIITGSFYEDDRLVDIHVIYNNNNPYPTLDDIEAILKPFTPFKQESVIENEIPIYREYFETDSYYVIKDMLRMNVDYRIVPINLLKEIRMSHPDYLQGLL